MVCKIRLGRGALWRGKTRKRAGGFLDTGGVAFYFERCQCHVDGKYYDPGGLCTGGKVRGILVLLSQRGDSCEKPSKEFASKVNKPLPPFAEESYILAVG
jgi:hypothetical protein